jgi:hypothetical protein
MRPSPPALLTAAAKRHPLHQAIPPAMTGYCIPNISSILFICACKGTKKITHNIFNVKK